jgi:hypothetical protein
VLRTLTPLDILNIATKNIPFDLHVLSTPPAFVLSQNQTLREKRMRLASQSLRHRLLRPWLNLTVHTHLALPDYFGQSAVGFVRSVVFEIKDLTCNAQFNFCYYFDRSKFVHFVPLWLAPALTKSCDKFQNQTFKDRWLRKLLGKKKLNLGADIILRLATLGHCRDKIEFNLKSQKLEEPLLFPATPLS